MIYCVGYQFLLKLSTFCTSLNSIWNYSKGNPLFRLTHHWLQHKSPVPPKSITNACMPILIPGYETSKMSHKATIIYHLIMTTIINSYCQGWILCNSTPKAERHQTSMAKRMCTCRIQPCNYYCNIICLEPLKYSTPIERSLFQSNQLWSRAV